MALDEEYKKIYQDLGRAGYQRNQHNFTKHIRLWLPFMKDLPVETMLDVGCGAGGVVRYCVENFNWDATGIDINPTVIKQNSHLELYEASIFRIPFNTNSFDMVTCVDVLEHIFPEDIMKAIPEVVRVGKKYYIIGTKNQHCKIRSYDGTFIETHPSPHPIEWWINLFEQEIKGQFNKKPQRVIIKNQTFFLEL